MEGQITFSEYLKHKEEIKRLGGIAASSFVGIGYLLKQIRDSKAYTQDGYEDLHSFAQAEFGYGKSTVSRFIAINDNFSVEGNSLELTEEYKKLGSSQLTEMLGLSKNDRDLITEQTTVREIREYKQFKKEEPQKAETTKALEATTYTLLEKLIINFFSEEIQAESLKTVMDFKNTNLQNRKTEECDELIALEINKSGFCTHRKGILFLFMYDFDRGLSIAKTGQEEKEEITWPQFIGVIEDIYETSYHNNPDEPWEDFYKKVRKENKHLILDTKNSTQEDKPETTQEKSVKVQEKPVTKTTTQVATSQQNTKKQEDISDGKSNDREGRKETKEEPIEQIKSNGENTEVSKDNNLPSRELESSENEETEKNQTILSPVVTEEPEPIVETVKKAIIKQFPSVKLESKEERELDSEKKVIVYSDISRVQEDINELENGIWEVLRISKDEEESEEIEDYEINEENLERVKNAKEQALKIVEDLTQIIAKWNRISLRRNKRC